jgi:low temperature requirement protein LtrA
VREARPLNLMRARAGAERVTNIELFFDLVYVFAVTQLSHYLLAHPTVTGALRAGLMLAALLGLAAPHVSELALGACAAAVVLAVATLDYALHASDDARTGGGGAGAAAEAS